MKIRSKKLLIYLLENNIDFQDQEALFQAKKEYRKEYKRKWKRSSKRKHEVRPCFSEYEYQELQKRALLLGLPIITYVREIVLSNQENRELIPRRDQLLKILQLLSMSLRQNNSEYANDAEQLLIKYLKTL